MKNYRFETRALHVGQEHPDIASDSRAVPIYLTTSYVFKNSEEAKNRFALSSPGNIYTRLNNTTSDIFERRITSLEGGALGIATSSGASSISYAIKNIAISGDHIISANNVYGGTFNLFKYTLKDYGIETTFVNPKNLENFEKAILKNTKLIFIESMGNPSSDVVDIEGIANIAHRHNIPLIVDNTFGTPFFIRPIEYGADIVVHSATKFICGHGTVMGGVIIDSGNFDWGKTDKFIGITSPNQSYHGLNFFETFKEAAYIVRIRAVIMRDEGAVISPFNSFMLLQGLETLHIRMERHFENTKKVLEYLSNNKYVEKIHHPLYEDADQKNLYNKYFPKGGGSIFTFEIKGNMEAAKKFTENLELFSLLANVGDAKSLVIHPSSTTHSQLSEKELLECNIHPNTVRLSIGLEHIDDILEDLEKAFSKIKDLL